jgi:acetate kinase
MPMHAGVPRSCLPRDAMDAILVVNAGSSSLKFQVFETDRKNDLKRLIKGQLDGIGTRPRLRAEASDRSILIDQTYVPDQVADVSAAIRVVEAQNMISRSW